MEQEAKEEKPMKRKLWVTYKEDKLWHVVKASGFYPTKDSFTPEEFRDFVTLNDDVEPVLNYGK